ncbi:MAG TPA: DUF2299 family protein [Thermoanaerobaculia bacterium]|nr:DUF2299 family protein [Thermoanaerobaculia bacterium]
MESQDDPGRQLEGELDLREQVQLWLMGEGWKLTETETPDAQWLVQAEDEAGRKLLIGQSRFPPDQLRIIGLIVVSDEHREQYGALSQEERDLLMWNLRFLLLMMNVEFSGIGEPLQTIEVSQRAYLDGLSKDSLMQRVSQTKNALIAVLWSFARSLSGDGMAGGEFVN